MAYKFDHEWRQERERLATLEEAFDPWSIRTIEATALERGSRCLEVGGGGGSIAEWLCRRVGDTGRVVATDLETKFLAGIDASNLDVRQHNIVSDPIEQDWYDLIHTRAVLEHIPERDEVFGRLLSALKPGGWLTVDCGDFSSVRQVAGRPEDVDFFKSAFDAVVGTSRSFGADLLYGRRIGEVFRANGLEQVVVEGSSRSGGRSIRLGAYLILRFSDSSGLPSRAVRSTVRTSTAFFLSCGLPTSVP